MHPLTPFDPWRDAHRRTARKPKIGRGPSRSHFGGAPWLPAGAEWPRCGSCGEPIQLLLQLDLAALPDLGSGLLQVFYCTRDECAQGSNAWAPFADSHVLRVVDPSGPGGEPEPLPDSFPAKAIVGWDEVPDLPDPEEHRLLGITYDYDFQAGTLRISCPALGVAAEGPYDREVNAESLATAEGGDKVGGWPRWIQSVDYPSCPACGARMDFVLQLDSDAHLPWMWGDAGMATVTRCPTHRDTFALSWSCH